MKSYSFAIVAALFCIVLVSGAPSTSNDETDLIGTFTFSDKLKCARDVTVELVNDAELKDELDGFTEAIDILWKENELCIKRANGKVVALFKCEVEATKSYYNALYKFINDVSKKRNDLVKKILEEVKECFTSNAF